MSSTEEIKLEDQSSESSVAIDIIDQTNNCEKHSENPNSDGNVSFSVKLYTILSVNL